MHKYEVIIYWSNDDGTFVAEVPELPGCSAHGDTKAAALQSVERRSTSGSIRRGNSATPFPTPRVNA